MKQFNLLIVSKDQNVSGDMHRISSKVFRKSFVLQAEDMREASTLLKRLSINVLLVDLDSERVDFKHLNQSFSRLVIIGMTNNPGVQMVPADPHRNRILLKRELATSLPAELKAIRKHKGHAEVAQPKQNAPRAAAMTDFKDFVRLVPTR